MKSNDSVDLSPAATTIAFNPVIPLLRVPLQAGENDDPSKGPYVLAFKDEDSWRRAWLACESRVAEQCEAGVRMGCSISASNKCKPPWWKNLFRFDKISSEQIAEREACEEREMKACLVASRDKCTQFAKDTCRPAFADARIAKPSQKIASRFTTHNFRRVTCCDDNSNVKSANKRSHANPACPTDSSESDSPQCHIGTPTSTFETTNYHARTLLGETYSQRHWEGPAWHEGLIQSDEFESYGGGWEGGLVRPKIESKKMEPLRDAGEPVTTDQPIWSYVQQQVKNKLKDLRFI